MAITVIELLAPRTAVVRWGPREKYQQQRNRIEATRFGCASVCERMGWGVDIFLSAESASVCCFCDYYFIPRLVGNPLQVQGLRIWYLGVREREGNVIWFGLKIYRQKLFIKKDYEWVTSTNYQSDVIWIRIFRQTEKQIDRQTDIVTEIDRLDRIGVSLDGDPPFFSMWTVQHKWSVRTFAFQPRDQGSNLTMVYFWLLCVIGDPMPLVDPIVVQAKCPRVWVYWRCSKCQPWQIIHSLPETITKVCSS